MKATGEVMAIDRTFGVGPEQGAPRPRAGRRRAARRGPELDAELRLPRRGLRRRRGRGRRRGRRRRSRSAGSTRPARPASRPATPSEPPRRSSSPTSSRRPTRASGGSSACSAAASPRQTIQEATGIAPWFLAEMGRNVALEAEVRAIGRDARDDRRRAGRRGGHAARDREAGGLRRPGARDDGRDPRRRTCATRASRSASGPATRWSTPAPRSSRPRRRTSTRPTPRRARSPRRRRSRRPAALVIGSGPGPDRAGDRVRLLRGAGRRDAPRARLAGGDDQLEPGDRLDRLRRELAALLRAARRRERPERRSRPRRGPARRRSPRSSRTAARRRSTSPRRSSPAGVPLLGSDLEAIDQAEERTRFSALLDRLGIPQPEGGMAHSIEEALTLAERIGYPVIVRPSFVIGGLAIDFCYSPEDLVRQLAAATVVDPDRPVRIDRYLEGDRGRRRRGQRRRAGPDPGPPRARRAGRRPQRRLGRRLPAAAPSARATRTLIVATMERIVLALGVDAASCNAQFIVRDDGVYLIEVNPRASRTVPFMSKVTGVPMVELAVRIALGESLADARLAERPARAAAVRRGQGAGVLDGEAARRRPVGRAGDAVDRRGDRDRRRTRGWRSRRR